MIDFMVNTIFKSQKVNKLVTNNAGGKAHDFSADHKLAQLAVTGTFNSTFYVDAQTQLESIIQLGFAVNDLTLAKIAIYARKHGFMKDIPSVCMAILANRNPDLFEQIFNEVIDNGRMIRNIVQIFRSGKIANRKSIPKCARRCIKNWLINRNYSKLFDESVGNEPSMGDVIKMLHPKAKNEEQEAFFGYLIGSEKATHTNLPNIVKQYELFKSRRLDNYHGGEIPNVEFRLLSSLNLTTNDWKEIALNGGFHMVRMNLNTFERHGVFKDEGITKQIANKLRDRNSILKSKMMPYQLFTAFLNISNVPREIENALQDAVEISLENIPEINGKCFIFPDVSGSMGSTISSKSKVRCIDIAALFSFAMMRKNPNSEIIPFEQNVVNLKLNSRDSIMTNAQKLASIGGGGTNCSAPLKLLNDRHQKDVAACIYISDNESWMDTRSYYNNKTEMENQWNHLKRNSPNAKLICIDLTPNTTTQTKDKKDVLNVGGFSDVVFDVMDNFIRNNESWLQMIEQIKI